MVNREDAAVGVATVVVGGGAIAAATATRETGPILAFVGALMVALIAGYLANRRQDRALDAEHERLEATLRHERTQADVLDLRAVLEESLGASDEALSEVSMEWASGVDDSDRSGQAVRRQSAHLNRLYVRLGQEDPIVEAYRTMSNALLGIRGLKAPANQEPDKEAWAAKRAEWAKAYHEYVTLASARVGSELDQARAVTHARRRGRNIELK